MVGRAAHTSSHCTAAHRQVVAHPFPRTHAERCPWLPLTFRAEDPDAIKLLKRELAIAVGEEDYRAAIRIRDHPYMQLYRRMQTFAQFGRQQEAEDLEAELHSMIRKDEKSSSSNSFSREK